MRGLECSGACLSDRPRVYSPGTQAVLPGPILRLLELPTAGSPTDPPLPWPRTPEVLSPSTILYA